MHVSGNNGRGRYRSRKSTYVSPIIDVSTMSLKSIIKSAYALEKERLQEEKRKKAWPSLSKSHHTVMIGRCIPLGISRGIRAP